MDKLGQNIQKRMLAKAMTQKGLALKAGLNETAVRDILRGRSKDPQISTLRAIARELGCGVEDLYGDPRPAGLHDPAAAFRWPDNVGNDAQDVVKDTDIVYIDEVDTLPAANAKTKKANVLHRWPFPRAMLAGRTETDIANLRIIRIDGDAMAPAFLPGDRVIVDTSATAPSPAGVFALWDGFGIILRRCEIRAFTQDVTVSAENPAYAAHTATARELDLRGRVLAKWTWL